MNHHAPRLAALPPRFGCLGDWLAWQESLHVREIELGLDRVRAVAERMGIGRPGYATVTVGGTNGKGSSVAMLDAILGAAGYRVGRYTSPHLVRYNERIRIGGDAVADDAICASFDRIDQARGDISLTYFEFGTLAALDIFFRSGIDVAILEVGMGGRLDAVNIIDADVALVATVDIDHVEWLGTDREAIGWEKAGIFRSARPAVCSDPQPPQSLRRHAGQIGSRLLLLGREYGYEMAAAGWSWWSDRQRFDVLPRPRLIGDFQLQNAAGVLMALQELASRCPVTRGAIEQGLRTVTLSGRFQVFSGPPVWILDVAHNPQSAHVLAETLRARPAAGRTLFMTGMLRDKDIGGVFRAMSGLADEWHLVTLAGRRGATAAQLADHLRQLPEEVPMTLHATVDAAFAMLGATAGSNDRILVFGSFLTVAGVAMLLERDGARPVAARA